MAPSRFLRGFTGKYRCRIYNAVSRSLSKPQVSQDLRPTSQASLDVQESTGLGSTLHSLGLQNWYGIYSAGSCRMRDIYRTRTYGSLQVSTGFTGKYRCRIYNAVSRSSSKPQVSQDLRPRSQASLDVQESTGPGSTLHSQNLQNWSGIYTSGSCRMRDIYRTRT